MIKKNMTRRKFIAVASAGTIATAAVGIGAYGNMNKKTGKLALLGGQPVRTKGFPRWPNPDEKTVKSMIATTKSGIWCRIQSKSGTVPTFEKKFAELIGVKYCVATGSGTQALHTALASLGVDGGDEVLVPPYTDPGSIAAIFVCPALPVILDIDPESFQIDPDKIEERINENTKAIMPVHIMGQPADIDRIMNIAKKHNLKVIEDTCQAHLAEYRGKKCGTIGELGCFSFQASKVLACGEGGAVIGNDEDIMDKCYTFQNHGTSRRGITEVGAPKYRMNEFEAAALLPQLETLEEMSVRRNENAVYLTSKLIDIQGINPQKLYDGTTRGTYYKYGFIYKKEHFNDIDRSKFLRALRAEGISCSGYINFRLDKEPWIENELNSNTFRKLYSKERLQKYREENNCPKNNQICDEMVVFSQNQLLGPKEDMDDIANAISKIYDNRAQLA